MIVTLEKHAPTKKRYTRAYQAPHMNKKLSKEINKEINTRSDLDRQAYNKQRNYLISLSRNAKKKKKTIL